MKFFYGILAAAAVYFAYKTNLYLGIFISLVVLVYVLAKFIPFNYQNKSRKAFNNGDYETAKMYYKKAIRLLGYNFETQMEYTYMLLRNGEFAEALDMMNKLLSCKMKPENRNLATVQRCMCYYKNDNLDEAYNDACELYNDGYRTMTLYGLLGYFKILKAPMAEDTMNFCLEAYDYADDDRDICDNLLICYCNRGEYRKAKEISDSVLENEPKFVEAWYHAAQIEFALGNFEAARADVDKIAECRRSAMTTVNENEITKLSDLIDTKLKEIN